MSRRKWALVGLSAAIVCCVGVVRCAVGWKTSFNEKLRDAGFVEDWSDRDGDVVRNVSYGPRDWNKLDLYVPKDFEKTKKTGAFLAIHGGSWTSGSRDDENAFCKRVAKAGYVAATIDYLLANDSNKNEYSLERIFDEIDAAAATLKKEASSRGVELEKVAITGFSAGGHLAMAYSYSSRGKNAPLKVAFVAPRVGPSDFHLDAWEPALPPEAVAGIVATMTGRPVSVDDLLEKTERGEAAIAAVSPVSAVATGAVPTLAAYGANDALVRPIHRQKLEAAFANVDVPLEVVEFPNSNHALWDDPDRTKLFNERLLEFARTYLDATDETPKKDESREK